MAGLNVLNLDVEIAEPSTGMAQAVLGELLEHLKKLDREGCSETLDILSLPLTSSDRRQLEEILGQGEISAVMNSFGESRIVETRFSGIWWIKHFTEDGALVSELIEITRTPEILSSQPADIRVSVERLEHIIQNEQTGEQP